MFSMVPWLGKDKQDLGDLGDLGDLDDIREWVNKEADEAADLYNKDKAEGKVESDDSDDSSNDDKMNDALGGWMDESFSDDEDAKKKKNKKKGDKHNKDDGKQVAASYLPVVCHVVTQQWATLTSIVNQSVNGNLRHGCSLRSF